MNEYIFYTSEGYTYPPKEDKEVENCQVLGRALGNSIEEAQVNLLKMNPWILDCGFDINEAICKQLVTEDIIQTLQRNEKEREFLVNLLDKRQLDEFVKWLESKE